MRGVKIAAALMLFVGPLVPASAWGQTTRAPADIGLRCEYARGDVPTSQAVVVFPDGDLFRPLLADPKEPRNSFGFNRVKFLNGAAFENGAPRLNVGSVSVGGIAGMWARKASACRGVQVSLFGGLFSEFNLDASSRDLINTDFVVGAQASIRTRDRSIRLRVFHQSSHLGDEFVRQNPSAGSLNFGFQGVDAVFSVERERLRAYGGGGFLVFMNGTGHSFVLHGGAEFRAANRLGGMFRPVAGIDVSSFEARSWGLTVSALGGLEWTSPAASRRMRALLVLVDGYTPFGHFAIEQKSRAMGMRLQIEF